MNMELHIIIYRLGSNNISAWFQTTADRTNRYQCPFGGGAERSGAGGPVLLAIDKLYLSPRCDPGGSNLEYPPADSNSRAARHFFKPSGVGYRWRWVVRDKFMSTALLGRCRKSARFTIHENRESAPLLDDCGGGYGDLIRFHS